MKKSICAILLFVLISILPGASFAADSGVIYQVSTLGALQEGFYDGVTSLDALKNKGDFGIGTFDSLDGEMLLLDGVFYQVKSDGHVYLPAGNTLTPFAEVTWFKEDMTFPIGKSLAYKGLTELIETAFPSKNLPYAVRIDGEFSYVKTRSVPAQVKPFPRLAEVVKTQPVFEMKNIKGTIIGFWLPQFYGGINMPGFHLHFISADKKSGGHLLDCTINSGKIMVEHIHNTTLTLPEKSDFFKLNLDKTDKKELDKIEK
jgi:acetolactate decarboxylase